MKPIPQPPHAIGMQSAMKLKLRLHRKQWLGLVALASSVVVLPARADVATWTYQTTSTTQFSDGLQGNTVASHSFAADLPGYTMQVSGWDMATWIPDSASSVTLPALTARNLSPAHDITEVGVGMYNGGDNEIRNFPSGTGAVYRQILQLSNLQGPVGTVLQSLHLVVNSVDYNANPYYNEGFVVYGSACADLSACTLTQLAKVSANATDGKNGYALDLAGNKFTPYTQFWLTADNGPLSSVILSSGTSVSSALAPVPEPASYALMLGGLGAIGLLLTRRRGGH